jgi:hypothetical protein
MRAFLDRFNYLFRSTNGLALLAIVMIALTTAIFSTLSGPMAEWGIKDWSVRVLGIQLTEAEREGRLILLYHSIAMAVIAIEVYFITDRVGMNGILRTLVNACVTLGYLSTLIFGLGYGYFGHNRMLHWMYVSGLSLMFLSGVLLSIALWPWHKRYRVADPAYAHGPGGFDLERAAFFTMALATLGSTMVGGIPAMYFGKGFETFLAEDVIREPHKTVLQLAVIGHLHIMLVLVAVAAMLIVSRWLDFKGILHKIAMPLTIAGTLTITLGAWLVVPFETIAHNIIYVGSVLVMLPALLLVIYGFRKLIADRLAEQGITQASLGENLSALLHDPLKFGALWQMVYMNFTTSGPGIFMAVTLDKLIRKLPAREERIILTGHWHMLSAIIATIILFYFADQVGLKGKARQWFGWIVLIGSDLAFAAMDIFELKRLFVGEAAQQSLVDWTMLFADIGLGSVMIALAILIVWRLVDLYRKANRPKKGTTISVQEVG